MFLKQYCDVVVNRQIVFLQVSPRVQVNVRLFIFTQPLTKVIWPAERMGRSIWEGEIPHTGRRPRRRLEGRCVIFSVY